MKAQELKIEFETLQKDLKARTDPRYDLNDEPCSLIRISAAGINDFVFEGNVIGEVVYSEGEAYVYMPQNSQRLTIKSNKYGVNMYEFPEPLQKFVVYKISLSPLTIDPFSSEELAKAKKVMDRYLNVTGFDKCLGNGVLSSFREVRERSIMDSTGVVAMTYDVCVMIDKKNEQMFFKDYEKAFGRNGEKYWAGLKGFKISMKRNKEYQQSLQKYFESDHYPFGLNMFKNDTVKSVYTYGGNVEIENKEYDVINLMNKMNEGVELMYYFDKATGLLTKILNPRQDIYTEYMDYQKIDDYTFCMREVTKNNKGMIIQQDIMKECCIGCGVNEELLNQKVIRKASDSKSAKKVRKKLFWRGGVLLF